MASDNNITIKPVTVNISNNFPIKRKPMDLIPEGYIPTPSFPDKLNEGRFAKTKAKIETALSIPIYALLGMKGDPDFNFYEYLKVSKIPYYLGGAGLAAVTLCGRNNIIPSSKKANNAVFKKMLTGVLMYYIFRDLANAAIDIPVKIFRGVDLNMPFRRITSLREGNPRKLPNNKKPSNQTVYESTEFTRWDLLYKHEKGANINERFDKLAKKFGADRKLNDSDSYLMSKINKLQVMATSWKYMLAVPFVTTGLGLAQQSNFEKTDFRNFLLETVRLFKPSQNNRWGNWANSFMSNLFNPVKDSFKSLWQGKSLAGKIVARGAIVSALGLTVLANAMILAKTKIHKPKDVVLDGGES